MKVLNDTQIALDAERVRRREVAPLQDTSCGAGTRFTIMHNDEVAPRIPDIAPGYGPEEVATDPRTGVSTHGTRSSAKYRAARSDRPANQRAVLGRYGIAPPNRNRKSPFAAFAMGEKEETNG
jgi:hypothetical protein